MRIILKAAGKLWSAVTLGEQSWHPHVLPCCSESAQPHPCKGALDFLLCVAVATVSLSTFHLASVALSLKTQVTHLPQRQTQGVDGRGHSWASMGSQNVKPIFSAHLKCTSARAVPQLGLVGLALLSGFSGPARLRPFCHAEMGREVLWASSAGKLQL